MSILFDQNYYGRLVDKCLLKRVGDKMNWWEKAPHRLGQEVTLMEQKFPQFQLGHSKSNRVINNMITLKKDQKYWLGK